VIMPGRRLRTDPPPGCGTWSRSGMPPAPIPAAGSPQRDATPTTPWLTTEEAGPACASSCTLSGYTDGMTTAPALTRAYIYGRQSQGSDASIDQQLEAGRDRADAEGWQVASEFRDGVSASRHSTRQRDDWPKLLAGVEAGHADVIWLWESSRGDRDLPRWALLLSSCRKAGVKLCIETHGGRVYDMKVPRE